MYQDFKEIPPNLRTSNVLWKFGFNPILVPPKTDIEVCCLGSAAIDASAGFSGILSGPHL